MATDQRPRRKRLTAAVALFADKIPRHEVARRYGCTENHVHQILAGKVPATERFKALVAEMVGLSVELIWSDTSQGEN